MPRNNSSSTLTAQNQQDMISEGIENFELPKSVVTKIAKSALPDNIKLQKETVLSLVKGSTVFINYLAHKSVSASDVLKALEVLEFGDLVAPLTAELNVYRGGGGGGDKARRPSATPTYSSATTGGKGKAPPGTSAGKGPAKGKAREGAAGASVSAGPSVSVGASASAGYSAGGDVDMDADVDAAIMDAAGVGDEDARYAREDARLAAEAAYALEGRSPPPAASYSEDAGDMDTEPPEDLMAVEEEELRQDARGVEERGAEAHP
ncbi:hypothetical protein HDZ31DRAFT_71848 [Schizophyllum fasciatum]